MKILAFDTSNNIVSVAISNDDNILTYKEDSNASVQAENLIPMIEEALASCNMTYNDVEFIAVTNGPGSFTGIRVGLACAKGLLLNNNILSSAVNNFEIYYYRATQQVTIWDKIIVVINAYREQLYIKIFDISKQLYEPLLLTYKEALELIESENKQHNIICTGNGISPIYTHINKLPNITILPRFGIIKATYICRFINHTLHSRNPLPMEPLYIRPPDVSFAPRVLHEK